MLAGAVAFVRFPAVLQAGVAYERGQRAERASRYPTAEAEYRKVVQRYPDSTHALARLAVAACRAGDVLTALTTMQKLDGRKADKDTIEELSQAQEALRQRLSGGKGR
jgi:hypothetical protein